MVAIKDLTTFLIDVCAASQEDNDKRDNFEIYSSSISSFSLISAHFVITILNFASSFLEYSLPSIPISSVLAIRDIRYPFILQEQISM